MAPSNNSPPARPAGNQHQNQAKPEKPTTPNQPSAEKQNQNQAPLGPQPKKYRRRKPKAKAKAEAAAELKKDEKRGDEMEVDAEALPNDKKRKWEEEIRADERRKLLKELDGKGVTLPESVKHPTEEKKEEWGLIPAQTLRKEKLLAALGAIKKVAAGERREEKELKAQLKEHEKKKEELDVRAAATKKAYNEIVAELKSLS